MFSTAVCSAEEGSETTELNDPRAVPAFSPLEYYYWQFLSLPTSHFEFKIIESQFVLLGIKMLEPMAGGRGGGALPLRLRPQHRQRHRQALLP